MIQETHPRIAGARIRNLRYLKDFGRIEADILLQFDGGQTDSPNVKIVTSVPARNCEDFESLSLRLTRDAAHLWRLLESRNFPQVSKGYSSAA